MHERKHNKNKRISRRVVNVILQSRKRDGTKMRSRRIPKKKKMGLRQENNIVKNNQQIILFPINLPVNLLGKKATNISEWKPLFWHLILEV